LGLYEFFDSVLFNERQVLDHTHSIIGAIPFVQFHQSVAGKQRTLITEINFTLEQPRPVFALFFNICALFVSRAAPGAFGYFKVIPVRKVPAADHAVHPAWRNQNRINFVFHMDTP
jgi:hypothetical protein